MIVGGTIVKIEGKIPEKEVKKVCNMEYNTAVPIRISDGTILYQINLDKMFIKLCGKNYSDSKVKGLVVKISIETIFNDRIEIPDMTFADISIGEEKEFYTEYNILKVESSIFKVVESIFIQIVKYVTEKNEVIEVAGIQDKKINLTQKRLMDIRKMYGNDAVSGVYKSDLGWFCYCGMENDNNSHKCQFCKREIQVERLHPITANNPADTFCLSEHLPYITSLKNAKEIYEYLVQLNCSDEYFNEVILAEIKKCVNNERLYGSMKDSVLCKLKELC